MKPFAPNNTLINTESPLRSRIMTPEQLQQHGIYLAESFNTKVQFFSDTPSRVLRAKFEENRIFLKNCFIKLSAAAKNRESLSSGAEWLLDNYHIIDQQIRQLRKNYTKGYDRTLPKLKSDQYASYPRIYELAINVVSHTDAIIEEDYLSSLVRGYQHKSPLTIGELWAIPIMLKFALIENISRLIRSIMISREERARTTMLIDSLFNKTDLPATELLVRFIKQTESSTIRNSSVLLIRKLREQGAKGVLSLQWLEEKLREQNLEPDELMRIDHQMQALDQISIGNSVTSLKNIGSINWEEWVEANSHTHQILSEDPADFYLQSDFKTRNLYRQKIEIFSRNLKIPEEEISRKLINYVRKAEVLDNEPSLSSFNRHLSDLKKHIGYYLTGKGKAGFEKEIGYQPDAIVRYGRMLTPVAARLYLIAGVLLTTLITYIVTKFISVSITSTWELFLISLLFVIPASDIAISFIQWGLSHLIKPEELSKYDFSKGIPESAKTLVAVQAIFDDKSVLERVIENLEVKYIANEDKNLLFAIIADFPDRKKIDPEQDMELLVHGSNLINALNQKYDLVSSPQFFILFRERKWNDKEERYMGWERKRGKVCELNRLILGRGKTSFIDHEKYSELFAGIKFVLTLDTDTQLPFASAHKLVGTIAHPLNKAVFDPKKRVVVDGYGIIQARVGISLISANSTRFSRIFAGNAGLDPYTSAIADFYQDVFGEGSFYGKGIYDVETFERAIAGRVPENAVLSHDLFEGLFARVGYCSDVEVIDEFPGKYSSYAKRQHRWVRGDWQLLPWFGKIIPNETYEKYRTPLTSLERWKLIDNLRRSLIAPALLAFILLGTYFAPAIALTFLTVSFLVVAFPVYTNVAQVFIMPPVGYSLSIFAKGFTKDILNLTQQAMLSFAFMPHQAYLMLHAIFITLKRVYFTKKNLLEWQTAQASERKSGSNLASYLTEMSACVIAGSLMLLVCLAYGGKLSLTAIPFFTIWIFAPWMAKELGVAIKEDETPLNDDEKTYLLHIAKKTWQYFKDNSAHHNHLIPDNVQVYPVRVEADRTSPTNIAMYLTSCLGAYQLGFEPHTEIVERILLCIQSCEKLEKHRGHLLNWYQTRTLEPLRPRYVSFVDSGNFAAALIAVREGLKQISDRIQADQLTATEEKEQLQSKIKTIIEKIAVFLSEMDFTFLFDFKKNLFFIGYNADDARLDQGHYDLLASESRLGSLVAIAKGDISSKHWFVLGRPIANTIGGKALLSWSGTMFEYLMPVLFTKNYPTTLLSETYKIAVQTQKLYAAKKGVPWGISESAYSGVDVESTYQYRAFGVPGLGLKRGLENDLVISPYSTALSLMVEPHEAVKNLMILEKNGLLGEYGFYESVDYTPDRLAQGEKKHIIHSFFAHHQGMSFISIVNALKDNAIQETFHNDPLIKSFELVLQEKFPHRVTLSIPQLPETNFSDRLSEQLQAVPPRMFDNPHSKFPRTHVLSNGKITTMIDNAGSGFTTLNSEIALTRWREDLITNRLGSYIYVKDVESKSVWSTAFQPTCVEPELYEVIFNADKVEIKRRDNDISLITEITVAPDNNVEIRKITITNLSGQRRILDLISYGEVVLASAKADQAHPAFAKMFIESEFAGDFDTLIFSRRPRSHKEQDLFLFHTVSQKTVWQPVQYETSRMNFIGRGNTLINSDAVFKSGLTKTTGFVLDPIFSLSTRIELEPNTSETVSFITGASESREEVIKLAKRFLDAHQVTRAFEMSWSQSSVELRNEQYTVQQTQLFQTLANALFFSLRELRAPSGILQQNKLTQSALWRYGISGDLPIVLVKVSEPSQIKLVQELLIAHYYLRNRCINFDLVILNEYTEGYFQNFQDELGSILRSGVVSGWADKRGGIFLRTTQQIFGNELILLETVSRVVLSGSKGSFAEQMNIKEQVANNKISIQQVQQINKPVGKKVDLKKKRELLFPNGLGGFTQNGKNYELLINDQNKSPLPWSNVIGQPEFGTLVTESGAGYTWSENSRENRLTPWSNDPVSDPAGEVIYIKDPELGKYWTPAPKPCGDGNDFIVTHGFGFTNFESEVNGIYSNYTQTISPADKIKWHKLSIYNDSPKERQLELYFYVEWVLGIQREDANRYIVSGFETTTQTLYSCNNYNNEFAGRCVYVGSNLNITSYTTDKSEFVGRNRDLSCPAFLDSYETSKLFTSKRNSLKLSNRTGSGFDSCAVLKVNLALKPSEKKEVLFYLAEAPSVDQLRNGRQKILSYSAYEKDLADQLGYWKDLTDKITVKTPNESFDLLMNGWLIYQTVSCRINARTAFYQNGGAFGFRDQLQDTLAMLPIDPKFARNQILLHAKHQFKEGDVQHWWHPPTGRGVRTKISDDLLWLPYVVTEYIKATGDKEILNQHEHFIEGQELGEAHEAYIVPSISGETGTIYEHCIRAINISLKTGSHGVPLIGCGDWNDGMNEVGKDGKGESVWLGWFLALVLKEFIPYVEDPELASKYQGHIDHLMKSIETNCWDGEWYLRAFFDDGTPLGSKNSPECKIDSLSQSWSIISGLGRQDRSKQAIENVNNKLVKDNIKIIQLLDPPFNSSELEPGYIKGYLPGVRENGGQYTHAAAWVIIANAMQKRADMAYSLFDLINPVNLTKDSAGINRYKAEPYVFCGDVYSVAPHEGRAGWSWYTGSAGWMYQAGLKYILGLRMYAEYFEIEPCIPKEWNNYSIKFSRGASTYQIAISNFSGNGTDVRGMLINGNEIKEKRIYFNDHQGAVNIEVIL